MADELQQQVAVLRKEAESLIDEYSRNPSTHSELIDRMQIIEATIEDIETKLTNAERTLTSFRQMVEYDILLHQLRLLKLSKTIQRHIAFSLEIHGVPVSKMLSFLDQLIECKPHGSVFDLATLVDCVSFAERPDFSPVQVLRNLKLQVKGNLEVSPFCLTDLLGIADSLSHESGSLQFVDLSCDIDGIHFNGKTVAMTQRTSRFGLGMALCMMGVCNKVEQLFSPTSIISHAAKVCHTICCRLLGDFITLEAATGDKRWVNLVYPELSRNVGIAEAVKDGIKTWQSAFDEFGNPNSSAPISFESCESRNVERCSGDIHIAVLFILRDISRAQRPIEIKVEGRSVNIRSSQKLDPFILQAARTFITDITQASSSDAHGRYTITLQL